MEPSGRKALVPQRVGYKNDKFGGLLTHPVKDTRHQGLKHEAEYCLDLLMSAGIEQAGLDVFIPAHKDDETWAANWFAANGITPGELIAFHPGASDAVKLWPAASFARLAEDLTRRYAAKIVLIGGPETGGIAAEIISSSKVSILDMTAKTTVGQMAGILRRCRLLVSNDSGPLHVGAAAGTHVIGLFLRDRPGINPDRWRPLGPKAFFLVDKDGSIPVEEVLGLAEQIFRQDSQSMFYW